MIKKSQDVRLGCTALAANSLALELFGLLSCFYPAHEMAHELSSMLICEEHTKETRIHSSLQIKQILNVQHMQKLHGYGHVW